MADTGNKKIVCVTGAGGFVASSLVKLLLSKGYTVHGTVRDISDEKNAHLNTLEHASDNLRLFKADLLNYESLAAAVEGCIGVFHVACPVATGPLVNPEVEMLEPAISGTKNVLNACLKAKVKRVVVVSSVGSVVLNPNWPEDQLMDEECWSDREFCRSIKNYYCLGKTVAEAEALEYGTRNGLDGRTVCPSVVIGPMMNSNTNYGAEIILTLLKDGRETLEDHRRGVVDVRDVAEALVLVYEKCEAKGRYICSSYSLTIKALAEKLKSMYPGYNYPKSFGKSEEQRQLTSEKLQKLGWKVRPLEESIIDSVKNYEEKGLLPKPTN